jgi:hypothetical protein
MCRPVSDGPGVPKNTGRETMRKKPERRVRGNRSDSAPIGPGVSSRKSVNATYKLGLPWIHEKQPEGTVATACDYMAIRLGSPSSDFLRGLISGASRACAWIAEPRK